MSPNTSKQASRVGVASAAALAAVLFLGACSSSAGKTGTTSTGNAPTTAGSSTTSTNAGSSQVDAAKAATSEALLQPTSIPLTTKLKSTPPSGKTFVFLQCELAQCKTFEEGVAAAT